MKTRDCLSEKNLKPVPAEMCGSNVMKQEETCKHRDCPVNGGWAPWTRWQDCSQNCIEHPEKEEYGGNAPVTSSAFMSRERHCTNPRPAFGGKKCVRNTTLDFNSKDESEEQRQDCYTELSKDVPRGAKVTPWCPQHCIYTQWSEWSACAETCITLNIENPRDPWEPLNSGGELKELFKYQVGKAGTLPFRQRMKCMLRPEKFGGACNERLDNMNTIGTLNGTTIWDKQQCNLCHEHACNDDDPNGIKDVRLLEPLKYPGDNPRCVGYCPVDCTMKMHEPEESCEVRVEEYHSEDERKDRTKNLISRYKTDWAGEHELVVHDQGCFASRGLAAVKGYGFKDNTETMVRDYLLSLFDGKYDLTRCKEKHTDHIFDHIEKNKGEDAADKVQSALKKDCKDLKDLLWEEPYEKPIHPIYDGLVGGKSCLLSGGDEAGKMVTSRKDLYEGNKANQAKYTNKAKNSLWRCKCHIPLCEMEEQLQNGPVIEPRCPYNKWTEWGPWGPCDIKCGRDGFRTSRRKCVTHCNPEEVHPDADCRPIIDEGRNITWTSKKTEFCDPCPADEMGQWTTWTDWAMEHHPECYKGDTVQYRKQTRTRVCKEKDGIKCAPNAKGDREGTETEEQTFPLPPCKAAY